MLVARGKTDKSTSMTLEEQISVADMNDEVKAHAISIGDGREAMTFHAAMLFVSSTLLCRL